MLEAIRRRIANWMVELLTEPLSYYERRGWNDVEALKRHIRKGDVVLVEGDTRISAVIKYLTQSSWSHSALYVGDELVRRPGELRERSLRDFGADAQHLMIEALPQGVVVQPLIKYVDFNIRLCRPHRLRPDDLQRVIDEAIAALGWQYDMKNILDLARYFLPVSLVPARYRRDALHFGSRLPTEVICSSLLGHVFGKVGYPITPFEGPPRLAPEPGSAQARARARWLMRLLGQDDPGYSGLFRMRHPTLLTPREFDLSPFFEIIKFNALADGRFDYTKIPWERPDPAPETVEAAESA